MGVFRFEPKWRQQHVARARLACVQHVFCSLCHKHNLQLFETFVFLFRIKQYTKESKSTCIFVGLERWGYPPYSQSDKENICTMKRINLAAVVNYLTRIKTEKINN